MPSLAKYDISEPSAPNAEAKSSPLTLQPGSELEPYTYEALLSRDLIGVVRHIVHWTPICS